MINRERIKDAIEAEDTQALLSLKSSVYATEFEEWVSLVPHRWTVEYDSMSLGKCSSAPIQCSPTIEYPSDWPRINLAYIGEDLCDHLGVMSIELSCPNCFTDRNGLENANAVHAWVVYNLHAWESTRNCFTLAKCGRCNQYALVSCCDWDSDPDYVFTYRGYLWLDIQDPIFDAIERIRVQLSINGRSK